MSDDFTTKPGFFSYARKAVVAFISTFVSAFGPAIVIVTSDGAVTWPEVLTPLVVALGLALAAGFAVFQVSNAPTPPSVG